MDLQRLTAIHTFYSQFLMTIYNVSSQETERDEAAIKSDIKKWLVKHKRNKTFGVACRHEIIFFEKETDKNSISDLRFKISNLEKNCSLIRMELESLTPELSNKKR
ncbi:hypothetical protein ACMGGR_14515 [Erwinia sp. BNK-24-b]|uniref:hypothetical protein n=1 Tax=Erwinia TaxID=551 RepID=UPI001FEF5817|nr:hypothetical protein [Erwinia phyllosphaerae]MBV4367645.1 hypothetical protein [Erwinia phyllosphaerae]